MSGEAMVNSSTSMQTGPKMRFAKGDSAPLATIKSQLPYAISPVTTNGLGYGCSSPVGPWRENKSCANGESSAVVKIIAALHKDRSLQCGLAKAIQIVASAPIHGM